MTVSVIKKHSQSFALWIAIVVVVTLAVLGFFVRFIKHDKNVVALEPSKTFFSNFSTISESLLIPVVELDIKDRTQEKNWTTALAVHLSGQAEVTVPYGRVDVLTSTYAIEIDFLHKWKEGVGQALSYASVKGVTPCLALIYERTDNQTDADVNNLLSHIETLCTSKGIRFVILKQR